jgi:hypothetical protein
MSDPLGFPADVFRRIGYMKIYMQDSLGEPEFDALPPASQEKLRERVKTYGEAIDDVLAVLREMRLAVTDDRQGGQPQ